MPVWEGGASNLSTEEEPFHLEPADTVTNSLTKEGQQKDKEGISLYPGAFEEGRKALKTAMVF